MRKLTILVAMALMVVAALALSGVAQAAPISNKADALCAKEAIKTLGPSFNPSNYTFHGGTEADDTFTDPASGGPHLFCGFGGNDVIPTLAEDDIFLGGAGTDRVGPGQDPPGSNFGTFYGQEGDDGVIGNRGIFYGGAGDDGVSLNFGTFYGQEGDDAVLENEVEGTFYGGDGNDLVVFNFGAFNGGPGVDLVVSGNPPVDGPSGT